MAWLWIWLLLILFVMGCLWFFLPLVRFLLVLFVLFVLGCLWFFLPSVWFLLVLFVLLVLGCRWFMDKHSSRARLQRRDGFETIQSGFDTIRNLEREMKNLIFYRDHVLRKVGAMNETEKVNDAVLEWLNEAEKLLQEANKLKGKNSIFYFVEKKLKSYDEMQTKMKVLNTKCRNESSPIYIVTSEDFSFGNIVWFRSTNKASKLLIEALYDDRSFIVGLHGTQGSGKTKLVKAVAEKVSSCFRHVVFATVSKNPNIKIQGEIAEWLNLKLEENSEVVRAKRIFQKLQRKGSFLVILDDVRAKLELEDIGIPRCSKSCRVLLSTRSQQVCNSMHCHRVIPLNPLLEEEAWIWLKEHSGIDDKSPSNILNVAQEVAVECKGIPERIKQVGSSLRKKTIEEWEASLDRLRSSNSTANYQIFLSFRGEDTRYSFIGFLYDALCREGFKTFMDEEGLQNGDQISQSLVEAIQASRLSIVVFSENYAYSSWCLDELITILECMKTKKQLVWPIFYKVDPSDVRSLKNSYGKAMDDHKNKFGDDSGKVQKWKLALSEIASLSGLWRALQSWVRIRVYPKDCEKN